MALFDLVQSRAAAYIFGLVAQIPVEGIEPPVGADAHEESVVDLEEISAVALVADCLDAGGVIEEDKEAVHLGAKALGNAPLHAEPCRAADGVDIPGLAAFVGGVVELGIDEGEAGRRVEQEIVVGVAHPGARRGEVVAVEVDAVGGVGELGFAAVPIETCDIALEAQHQGTHLPVEPDLTAAQHAEVVDAGEIDGLVGGGIGGPVDIGIVQTISHEAAPAHMSAGINSRPVIAGSRLGHVRCGIWGAVGLRKQLPVGADPENEAVIDLEVIAFDPGAPETGQARGVVEHQVEALGLEGEVRGVLPLDAAADHAADRGNLLAVGRCRHAVQPRPPDAELAFQEGGAAGQVIKHIVSDQAGSGARRRQEIDVELHCHRRDGHLQVGDQTVPVDSGDIALEAEQERAHLPVVADLAAAHETAVVELLEQNPGRIGGIGRRRIGHAIADVDALRVEAAVAGVNAEVEAAPVVGRDRRGKGFLIPGFISSTAKPPVGAEPEHETVIDREVVGRAYGQATVIGRRTG